MKGRRDRAAKALSPRVASVASIASIAFIGCAPAHGAAFGRSMEQASRDEGAGRFADAAIDYDGAARVAWRPRDRDEARWSAAEMATRAGHLAEANDRLEAIAADKTSENRAAAAFRLAVLHIEHGDADRGWQELEGIPRQFPEHGVAHVAVRKLIAHSSERGLQAGLEEVRALERDLAGTELVELVTYLDAEQVDRLGNTQAARDAYIRVADRWPYPFGAFFDDSLWRASVADEKLGHDQLAVDDLERLLRERETTILVGSYERPRFVAAVLRVGELYRDKLGDRARARASYHRLYADFAHSSLRDRGLWLEAALWRDDGDARTACERLGTLVNEFPDSRYVPCAIAQCSALTRPSKSEAPRECHPYITRTRAETGASDPTGRPGTGDDASAAAGKADSEKDGAVRERGDGP